jgi:ribonuclease D
VTTSPIEVVETADAFLRLIAMLRKEAIVGIDTEAASFHRYHDRVYLLQLSSRTHTAVVDPLAVGGLDPLRELLSDERVELVFHDGDYDLRLLQHEYGLRVHHLFDTRIAAQFINEPGIGLAALLESRFGVRTDKKFQRADWSARPLSPEMIAYAATDTRYLPELRDSLKADLDRLGRTEWVHEECTLLTRVEWAAPEPRETAFLRLKGARKLDRRGLAVLRELFVWRDGAAAAVDRALFRVLGNEPMLTLAAERPTTRQALGSGASSLGRRTAAGSSLRRPARFLRGRSTATPSACRSSSVPRLERVPWWRSRGPVIPSRFPSTTMDKS